MLYKEQEILSAVKFNVGGYPTVLEFLNNYISQVFDGHEEKNFINHMSVYLAKMTMHHENLCHKLSSHLAVSCIYVALKICE